MTRRITWVILLTVWATLIAAGLTAYFTTRAVMLKHLHHAMLDELMSGKEFPHQGERYITVGSRHAGDSQLILSGVSREEPHAQIIRATWVRLPGESFRQRSIVAQVWARPVNGEGDLVQLTVPYRRRAHEFDPLMNQVALALTGASIVGGVVAAVLARLIAKTSLRPLRATADVIGTIDERSLTRRIEKSRLPAELVPMADKLNELLQRLETAAKQRQRFLADASHELRTPVASLMVALELAARKPRDLQTYRETLEMCLLDARHLRRLVEALMAQVKSEELTDGDIHQVIDLSELIYEVTTIVEPLARNRSMTIRSQIGPVGAIRTQPSRLRSVLLNLLANAVEYGLEKGNVTLAVSCDGSDVEFEVSDDGPGIAAEQLPHVFEPFFRGDESRQASEHLGLGLFLVQSHIRSMGGQCKVYSELGAGTTFRIRLPGAVVEAAAPDSAAADASPFRAPARH